MASRVLEGRRIGLKRWGLLPIGLALALIAWPNDRAGAVGLLALTGLPVLLERAFRGRPGSEVAELVIDFDEQVIRIPEAGRVVPLSEVVEPVVIMHTRGTDDYSVRLRVYGEGWFDRWPYRLNCRKDPKWFFNSAGLRFEVVEEPEPMPFL